MANVFDDTYAEEYDPASDVGPLDPLSGGALESLPVSAGGQPADIMMDVDVDAIFGEFQSSDWGSSDPGYHDTNLAQFLDAGQLTKLAQNVDEWVDKDRLSRKQWESREADGIRKLGLSPSDVEAVKNSVPGTEDWRSTATHPGLMKACIQFWARSYTELWPAGGPAKSVVLGESTAEREQQAARVKGFLNYLYTQEMPGASHEASQALFRLPLSGSVFRKAYFDPVLGTICVRFLESQDFVKPYSANDLGSAPRYTHIVRMTRNDFNLAIRQGYYLSIPKSEPDDESVEHQALDVAIDSATGVSPVNNSGTENDAEYDNRDILYEMSVTMDLADYGWTDDKGETWKDPETGDRVSIGVPYRVTVHAGEQKTVSIRRDWREGDLKKRRRRDVIEYKFLPGFGGYGFGLLHIAGGLSDAQTGFVRYLLDGCTLDTVGKLSGWVNQNAIGVRGLPPLKLGQFQPVPGVEDLGKAIMTPDFQWRTNNTLETLQYLDVLLDTLVASTESMIGDANKDMPVGTILARIEQASKPFAAIFGLLHASLGEELKAVADLATDYLPERYPYAVEGADNEIFSSDFDQRVDVVPVSDPNIVSSMQRMAQAQVVMEQAEAVVQVMGGAPEAVRAYLAAYQNLLEVMRVPNPERFVPQPAAPQPQAPAPDKTEADIARADALAVADSQRKDAVSVSDQQRLDAQAIAEQRRQAEKMNVDSAARANGDRAIQAVEQGDELEATQREIANLAAARQRQMAGQVSMPGAG